MRRLFSLATTTTQKTKTTDQRRPLTPLSLHPKKRVHRANSKTGELKLLQTLGNFYAPNFSIDFGAFDPSGAWVFPVFPVRVLCRPVLAA